MVGSRRIVGRVGGLDGDRHVTVSYSTVKGKRIIAAWVGLLALTLNDPDAPVGGVRRRPPREKKNGVNAAPRRDLAPLGATADIRGTTAREILTDLLALHDDGLREPLVVPADSASAYAIQRVRVRAVHGRRRRQGGGAVGTR